MDQNLIKQNNILWYKRTYNSLIEKCKSTNYSDDIVVEIHHIVPKCMGGDNSKENLVKMPTREHIVAHMLLARIYPENPKIIIALALILDTRDVSSSRISSRMVAYFREERRFALSESRKGENNPNYGHKHSNESKKLMSEKTKGENHWLYGKSHKESTKKKISESLMGEKNPNYGKTFSEEHRKNISKSRKGKFVGEKNSFYGKHHSDDSRKLISEARLKNVKKVIDSSGEVLSIMNMAKKYSVSYSTIVYWIKHNPEKGIKYYKI